ncbi:MAG: CHAT domain-containing protein [candidate division Zixibacteria bacterium]|nr:CHAT domain-containing protein [candidate division Zixibacteria bacterium]
MEKETLDLIAHRFLQGHRADTISDGELAAACNRVIQQIARRSFKEAVALARKFVKRSTGSSPAMRLMALRAMARTLHMSGKHAEALSYYVRARTLCRRDPLTLARIDRALIDVYMYVSDFTRARRAARSAMTVFQRHAASDDLAQTRVNYGNLLHRQDRHLEAGKLYRQAAAHFAATGNRLAAARCYYNQANTLVQLFNMSEAARLYRAAIAEYDKAGYELDACDARYGLAWLLMLSGKFHVALTELAACERVYREAGDARGEALCLLDRAEVYTGLGLYSDALTAAAEAEKRFGRLRLRYEKSKAALFHGQAAAALGRRTEAAGSRRGAERGFTGEGNQGFLGATCLLAADLAGRDGRMRRKELAAARRHFDRAQLPYWAAICDLYEVSREGPSAPVLKRMRHNKALRAVPHLYALWQMALGDHVYRQGHIDEARDHWSLAADRLDAVRAQLPPLELRGAFGRRHPLPHPRLIAIDIDRRPLDAALWSERSKTAGLWAPLTGTGQSEKMKRSAELSLEKLAFHVGALSSQTWGARSGASTASVSGRPPTNLYRQVREELMALESSGGAVPSFASLRRMIKAVSHRLPVVQFHGLDDDIIAFVHRNGETRVRRFPGGVSRLVEDMCKWRFILEGQLLEPAADHAISKAEMALWQEVGGWLWSPLEIDPDQRDVLILPEGDLFNLPWPALIVDGRVLAERHRFILSPSLRHFRAAAEVQTEGRDIQIFRGATADLPETKGEIAALSSLFGSQTVVHDPCRRDDWPSSGEAFAWHFVGHASVRADNPFYSCLHLDDGPLFAADFRLKRCRVEIVTLSACRSGEQVSMPGEESTGLVRSILEMGARNVIASHWPVSDRSAALWMEQFYSRLVAGAGLPEAVNQASLEVRECFPSAYHWSAFAAFGAGNLGDTHEN